MDVFAIDKVNYDNNFFWNQTQEEKEQKAHHEIAGTLWQDSEEDKTDDATDYTPVNYSRLHGGYTKWRDIIGSYGHYCDHYS